MLSHKDIGQIGLLDPVSYQCSFVLKTAFKRLSSAMVIGLIDDRNEPYLDE